MSEFNDFLSGSKPETLIIKGDFSIWCEVEGWGWKIAF